MKSDYEKQRFKQSHKKIQIRDSLLPAFESIWAALSSVSGLVNMIKPAFLKLKDIYYNNHSTFLIILALMVLVIVIFFTENSSFHYDHSRISPLQLLKNGAIGFLIRIRNAIQNLIDFIK